MRDLEASEPRAGRRPCPGCKQPMRLVGRESHPAAPDLLTFQCACGQVFTDAMSKTPPCADDYRKRAAAIGKRLKNVKNDKKQGLEL